MSFSAGTFSINTTGQPVVTGTSISSTVFNALTADLATGLSTCMLKDGTQTATAGIGFYAGTVSLPGVYFGTDTATGLYRIGLNNTGYSINGTKLLDLSSALVGITGALTVSTTTTLSGALTYGGVTLSNAVTGTGNMVLSASPTLTGTVAGAASTWSGTVKAATTIGVGNATPAATGAGITFPASQSDSSNANTLDDYEEGTFTPVLSFGGGTTGITYSAQLGTYTKIGDRVSISIRIVLTNKGSSTGGASVAGLPFTVKNDGVYIAVATVSDALSSVTGGTISYAAPGGTSVVPNSAGTGTLTQLADTNFANNSSITFSFVYGV